MKEISILAFHVRHLKYAMVMALDSHKFEDMRIFISVLYLVTMGVSFFVSLRSFRLDFARHLRMFSLLLGLTFLVELSAVFMPKLVHIKINSWLYNSFTLIEFSGYAWYYQQIIQISWMKKGIIIFRVLFPLFWLTTVVFVFGFTAFNSYVIVVGAFFTVCFAILYYFQLLAADRIIRLSRSPEFWIATGMLILYSCQIPFYGMLNFLSNNYLVLARQLLALLTIMNITMYGLFIYAYLCQTNTERF